VVFHPYQAFWQYLESLFYYKGVSRGDEVGLRQKMAKLKLDISETYSDIFIVTVINTENELTASSRTNDLSWRRGLRAPRDLESYADGSISFW
jgi:hypothetical protein